MDNLKLGMSVHPDTIKKTTTERGKIICNTCNKELVSKLCKDLQISK